MTYVLPLAIQPPKCNISLSVTISVYADMYYKSAFLLPLDRSGYIESGYYACRVVSTIR